MLVVVVVIVVAVATAGIVRVDVVVVAVVAVVVFDIVASAELSSSFSPSLHLGPGPARDIGCEEQYPRAAESSPGDPQQHPSAAGAGRGSRKAPG